MAGNVLERISEISNILGLGALVGIIAFLILCWRRIYYVGKVVMFSRSDHPYLVFR